MSFDISGQQAFYWSTLAGVGFVCIAAAWFPKLLEKNNRLNWGKIQRGVYNTGNTAALLLPALSAGFLPLVYVDTTMYALTGFGIWALGTLFGMGKDCKSSGVSVFYTNNTGVCTRAQTFQHFLGEALQTAGSSFGVGALLAFARTRTIE